MLVRKNMTNGEIYSIAIGLTESVVNTNLSLPIKINFYLQKNITALLSIAEEIEKARTEILEKYGTRNEEGNYDFTNDAIENANKELGELFSLEQEVPVYELSLDDFGERELNSNEVKAILYMIKEEE